VRHTSFADAVIAALLISARYKIRLRYVMKRQLLWDPCLDIVGHRLRNYFVTRTDASSAEIEAVGRLAEDLNAREGVLIYPEGTRFTPAKRERVLNKLRQSEDTNAYTRASEFKNVLPPRIGGTLALLEKNSNADAVFCAHAGLQGSATLHDVLNGAIIGNTVRVAFWGVAYGAIPEQREARADWFHAQWRRVDEWVAAALEREDMESPRVEKRIEETEQRRLHRNQIGRDEDNQFHE